MVEEVVKPYHEDKRGQLFGLVREVLEGDRAADPAAPAAGARAKRSGVCQL